MADAAIAITHLAFTAYHAYKQAKHNYKIEHSAFVTLFGALDSVEDIVDVVKANGEKADAFVKCRSFDTLRSTLEEVNKFIEDRKAKAAKGGKFGQKLKVTFTEKKSDMAIAWTQALTTCLDGFMKVLELKGIIAGLPDSSPTAEVSYPAPTDPAYPPPTFAQGGAPPSMYPPLPLYPPVQHRTVHVVEKPDALEEPDDEEPAPPATQDAVMIFTSEKLVMTAVDRCYRAKKFYVQTLPTELASLQGTHARTAKMLRAVPGAVEQSTMDHLTKTLAELEAKKLHMERNALPHFFRVLTGVLEVSRMLPKLRGKDFLVMNGDIVDWEGTKINKLKDAVDGLVQAANRDIIMAKQQFGNRGLNDGKLQQIMDVVSTTYSQIVATSIEQAKKEGTQKDVELEDF